MPHGGKHPTTRELVEQAIKDQEERSTRDRVEDAIKERKQALADEVIARQETAPGVAPETGGRGVTGAVLERLKEIALGRQSIANVPVVSPAIRDASAATLNFVRRNITEPVAAAATVVQTPSFFGLPQLLVCN